MRKLLSFIGTISLGLTSSSAVIACTTSIDKFEIIDLEKHEIDLNVFSTETIKIKNRSSLNGLSLKVSDSNLIATIEGSKNDEITLTYRDNLPTSTEITVEVTAKNGFDETIKVNLKEAKDEDLVELKTNKTSLEMKANSEETLIIENWEKLIGLDMEFDVIDTTKITKKLINNTIVIRTKNVNVNDEFTLTLKAKNAKDPNNLDIKIQIIA